jgi:hypothetical protein
MKYFLIIIAFAFSFDAFSQLNPITVKYERKDDKSIDFYYEKEIPGSFYLTIEFSNISNTHTTGFKGNVSSWTGRLFSLRPINPNEHINFSYKYSYIRGASNPKADKSFTYVLPFKEGRTIKAVESPNLGENFFNNIPPKNWKSYQFNLPEPDTVCAVRKGIVVKTVDKYNPDTTKVYNYSSNQNSILVEHADGTFASYTGFCKEKIFVEPGQIIYPQSPLGVLRRIDKRPLYRLCFHIYFLISTDLESKRDETMLTRKSMNEFLTPNFYTSEGVLKLKEKEKYTVAINEEIYSHELTRKEKKKMKKHSKAN